MLTYSMTRGDTFKLNVQVLAPPDGSPPGTPPQPVDITGWKLWFSVKRSYSDADSYAVFQGTTVSGAVVITDAVSGKASCTMPAITTKEFPDLKTTLVYDVQAKDTNGNISTVEAGTLAVIPDVTRALA